MAFAKSKTVQAQSKNDQKVILMTLDGYRWQELFPGADAQLITNEKYVEDTTALKQQFWKESAQERRETLMPFIWTEGIGVGEIHGNREKGSKFNLTNGMWFSYPGYNEILTGKADDKNITSNDKIYNPNTTILEKLNQMPRYKDKVVAFASWDVFPYIINDKRSGVHVNAGYVDNQQSKASYSEKLINRMEEKTPSPFGNSARLDVFTDYYALEYMKQQHPDMVYIANDETDDFAHQGKYDKYLNAAHDADAFLKELWYFVQSDPYYKDKTTIILTTDHGRGTQPLDTWRSHGNNIQGADQTWMIVLGAQAKKMGEATQEEQLHTTSVAERIMSILK